MLANMPTFVRIIALSLLASATLATPGLTADQTQTWVADPRHSSAQFTVTHLGISHVRGIIPITSATITGGTPQLPARVDATLDASGIDTRNDTRDNDLKSPHFFDASRYPTLTFSSTSVSPIDAKSFSVIGNLTLHGVTRPVTLKATFLGQMVGERGDAHAAYEAATSIKRSDFGMTYMPYVVGDDVDIDIDIEALARK
jgi:polyisoprenoid-binding protein YceI